MSTIVSVKDLRKSYANGFTALNGVDLDIREGEILALLGPNGAGKTTLISSICGITQPTGGQILVGGHDAVRDYRKARALIGLVPQDLSLEIFETVFNAVSFTRGLFGKPRNDALIDDVLKKLGLYDKRNERIVALSGGMKRRVMIAKALSHEPRILFLDEPTAGVDVELRQSMWELVDQLRRGGVTVILTTHYLEEAEAMADRVAVIDKGRILLVQDKTELMRHMGQKEMTIHLAESVAAIPEALADYALTLAADGSRLTYAYDTRAERTGITRLLADLQAAGLHLADLETRQSSLEEIFVSLVRENA